MDWIFRNVKKYSSELSIKLHLSNLFIYIYHIYFKCYIYLQQVDCEDNKSCLEPELTNKHKESIRKKSKLDSNRSKSDGKLIKNSASCTSISSSSSSSCPNSNHLRNKQHKASIVKSNIKAPVCGRASKHPLQHQSNDVTSSIHQENKKSIINKQKIAMSKVANEQEKPILSSSSSQPSSTSFLSNYSDVTVTRGAPVTISSSFSSDKPASSYSTSSSYKSDKVSGYPSEKPYSHSTGKVSSSYSSEKTHSFSSEKVSSSAKTQARLMISVYYY